MLTRGHRRSCLRMSKRSRDRSGRYVSRGGDKLERSLDAFEIDATGRVAADLGANVGGFTDCLLQRGAARIYAVETGYGVLDWKLRQDERVEVMERTNAIHATLPESVDLVVADVGWTPLHRYVPTAIRLLKPGGRCVVLLKPQYEVAKSELVDGHVDPDRTEMIVFTVIEGLKADGVQVSGQMDPDLESRGRNPERFLLLEGPSEGL